MNREDQIVGIACLQRCYEATFKFSDDQTGHNVHVSVPVGKKAESFLSHELICAIAVAKQFDLADIKIQPMPKETVIRLYMNTNGAKVFGRIPK